MQETSSYHRRQDPTVADLRRRRPRRPDPLTPASGGQPGRCGRPPAAETPRRSKRNVPSSIFFPRRHAPPAASPQEFPPHHGTTPSELPIRWARARSSQLRPILPAPGPPAPPAEPPRGRAGRSASPWTDRAPGPPRPPWTHLPPREIPKATTIYTRRSGTRSPHHPHPPRPLSIYPPRPPAPHPWPPQSGALAAPAPAPSPRPAPPPPRPRC